MAGPADADGRGVEDTVRVNWSASRALWGKTIGCIWLLTGSPGRHWNLSSRIFLEIIRPLIAPSNYQSNIEPLI